MAMRKRTPSAKKTSKRVMKKRALVASRRGLSFAHNGLHLRHKSAGLRETEYLLSGANRKVLLSAIAGADAGKFIEAELLDE